MSLAASRKHFDISQLPSLKDGMSVKEEALKRRKTCRFIEESGRILKLPRVAIATAMVFFHRFYAKHSFSEHDRFEVAVACIVLAAKTEESPKKLNMVIDECHKLKVKGLQAGRISHGPGVQVPKETESLDPKGEEFLKLKERILLLERVILHTIGFELSIDHPYKFLVEHVKKLVNRRQVEFIKPPAEGTSTSQVMSQMLNSMVQFAMNFANDSMHTSLCLQFGPNKIALACVYLAGHFAGLRPTQGTWMDLLAPAMDIESLGSICVQLTELITERKGADLETFAKIQQDLEALKKRHRVPAQDPETAVTVTASPPPPSQPAPPPEPKRQRTN